jgi:S-adenosylmethionine:tRNA ribosyltransferase-isomerase
VLVSDFDYHLPEELIAQEPLADRAASRMLVVYRGERRWEDRWFREFPSFVRVGDCLIVNDTKVFPSRLFGKRASGTACIEVFLLRARDDRTWEALVRPGRKAPVGERIVFSNDLEAEVIDRGEHGSRLMRFTRDVLPVLEAVGHVPLPPYIRRPDTPADRTRYQTVYAQAVGSVAAPTAGLHFTPEILERCRDAGATIAAVTLHVGLGTFAPVRAERMEDVELHHERFEVPDGAMQAIRSASRRIAVGTTSVRAVESAYGALSTSGETNLFISPGYNFHAIDALVTNFHLPRSSLLMLVAAFAGLDLTRAAYDHAVRERYRFFSYGDCMLIL